MSNCLGFGKGFPPRNIAIVGVSRTDHIQHAGYTGLKLLRILQESKFAGHIYPVNPRADYIEGLRVYPTVSAIPEAVDLATVTVPASAVPQVIEDCIAAGTSNVQICTSGFGETGQEEGRRLDNDIRKASRDSDIRIIGPNCMGFHVPSARIQMFENMPMEAGPLGFLSQSGGHARTFILNASHCGIGVSKVISYGNALMLDAPDFLEYLADDPETRVICMYLEGVQDGRRFSDLVKKVSFKKPVTILKGGLTEAGARAAMSHTASLAGNRQVWEAFFRQTGAIRAGSIEEMVETSHALLSLDPLTSARAAVLSAGGGDTVASGDTCIEEGLVVPPLAAHTTEQLLEFVYLVNQGITNPLDLPTVFRDLSVLRKVIHVLSTDPDIDLIMLRIASVLFLMGEDFPSKQDLINCLTAARSENPEKPIVVAITDNTKEEPTERHVRDLRNAGITAYESFRGACRAVNRFTAYHRYVAESQSDNGQSD